MLVPRSCREALEGSKGTWASSAPSPQQHSPKGAEHCWGWGHETGKRSRSPKAQQGDPQVQQSLATILFPLCPQFPSHLHSFQMEEHTSVTGKEFPSSEHHPQPPQEEGRRGLSPQTSPAQVSNLHTAMKSTTGFYSTDLPKRRAPGFCN